MTDFRASPSTAAEQSTSISPAVEDEPPTTGSDRASASPAPMDLQHLLDLVQGDEIKVRKYLRMFVDLSADIAADLASAVQAADLTAVRALSHKLKGASGMIGATDVARAAGELEAAAQAAVQGSVQSAWNDLALQVEAAVTFLRGYLG